MNIPQSDRERLRYTSEDASALEGSSELAEELYIVALAYE